MDTRIGRSGGIRTHGIHIPNVARYQLRYTPIFLSSVFYCRAWRCCPLYYRGCAAGFPARRGGCARRAHETLRVLFIIGKKQPRVKQNA